ncbi:Bbp16 family capsid cement protein [Chitinasiproducens palmae]|uniref:Phage protein n=1 Tax=Chitinasiproducens palmae TaxID=1770053 RepID=A0A1H2PRT0_9BURK|nr:hypothetical protein [Chitinasiproducens palmae]SDV49195.1 hypothetical protein SAMN05216551_107143 [Chitinasiproducens palmae]
MILDKTNEFSDSQVVTATAVSTNVIDLNPSNANPVQDIGAGEPVWFVAQVDASAAAAGAATVVITLESDSDPALATAPTVHYTSAAIPVAQLTAGAEPIKVRLPAGAYKRYLGVRYTVGTGPLTAGAFSTFITKDIQNKRQYKSGYSV